FFFQAEDGIRDFHVTGVQTCALPIFHPVATPQAEIGSLLPAYTYYRVVVEAGVAEIVFHHRLIIAQLAAPYQGIGQRAFNNRNVYGIGGVEHTLQPVQVFTVVYVGHLSTVDIKRRYRNPAGDIVPVAHYIFFSLAHSKGTALNKDETGTGLLVSGLGHLEAAHFFVIVVPSCNVG